jgi:hypothetical protein
MINRGILIGPNPPSAFFKMRQNRAAAMDAAAEAQRREAVKDSIEKLRASGLSELIGSIVAAGGEVDEPNGPKH